MEELAVDDRSMLEKPSRSKKSRSSRTSSKSSSDNIRIESPEDLVGVKFILEYQLEDGTPDNYSIEILSGGKVVWERVEGLNVGEGDTEDYIVTLLKSNVLLMSWVEASGLSLCNLIDFNKKTVLTHGNFGRSLLFENPGKVSLDYSRL